MIASQDAIEVLALRIERAYRRRHPRWNAIGLTQGVWESAASRLLEASELDSMIPNDPELFVAAQVGRGFSPDPWAELTQQGSLDRYRKALRRIIVQLRDELKAEVRRAKCRLLRGVSLDQVLESEGGLSPLTRYILAHRAGRRDLSMRHRAAAENQDRSCPLYRMAARSLLPGHAYPAFDPGLDPARDSSEIGAFSLN